MQKTFCDKCGKEGTEEEIIAVQKSLVDSEDRGHIIRKLDLCEECRLEFRRVVYEWLYRK